MAKNIAESLAETGTAFKHQIPSRVDVALEQDRKDDADERRWNKEIDLRDGRCCRACSKRTNPDDIGLLRGHRAHIIYASASGSLEPSNRVTLCPGCHSDEHADRLRFSKEGGPYVGIDANGPMEFWRDGGGKQFYLSRCELAPGVVRKD